MLGIGGDRQQRLEAAVRNKRVVDHCLVLIGDRGDLGGQREDHVEIADRQQIGLARAASQSMLPPHPGTWGNGGCRQELAAIRLWP